MMKFIDDGYNNPRGRLQLMLELTSELVPGTEVYKLYDRILSTCADPKRAYLHLSVVAALADPLPISQISELLGPGEGKDVEIALVQLRSVMDIPADSSLPVNIYHSSIRDYVSDPSNCGLPEVQHFTSPHSLLAHSSLSLMIPDVPGRANTALLDALLELKGQSRAMQSDDLGRLKYTLSFIAKRPEPQQVVIYLLWLRGARGSGLQQWLGDLDGRSWLRTQSGKDWLQTQEAEDWLQTRVGEIWLQTWMGKAWLETQSGQKWLQSGRGWLWAQKWPKVVGDLGEQNLFGKSERLETQSMNQMKIQVEERLDEDFKRDSQTEREQAVERLDEGSKWGSQGEPEQVARWGQVAADPGWRHVTLLTLTTLTSGEWEWLQTPGGREWLQTLDGREWLQTPDVREWLRTPGGCEWLQTPRGCKWLQTPGGCKWLQTPGGRERLQTQDGREWLQTQDGHQWLQTPGGHEWLQTPGGREWLQTQDGREWLRTLAGHEWLQTQGDKWLQTSAGQQWLQTVNIHYWLRTQSGQDWLQSPGGQDWLKSRSGRDWMQTPDGQAWQLTPAASIWLIMEDLSSTLEAMNECPISPELLLSAAFQVIQNLKSLPDFLILPVFLALLHHDDPVPAFPYDLPDMDIIHAMTAFTIFANEAQERSRSASDALKYACQNFAVHLSRAPKPWDDNLHHTFKSFWNHHLLSWLERQWCLKGLRSCLVILSVIQKLAKVCNLLFE